MAVYKLLKKYPNSLEIVKKVGDTIDNGALNDEINPSYFTDYPEFWELVPEKNYEIIEFFDGYNRYYKSRDFEGTFTINTARFYTEKDLLRQHSVKINSVKRLSDGETFKVSELIIYEGVEREIFSFEVVNNVIETMLKQKNPTSALRVYNFDKIIKRKPLLITEDGVDKYVGDNAWYYDMNFKNHGIQFLSFENVTDTFTNDNVKFFSERKYAENFEIENTPSLSLSELRQYLPERYFIMFKEDLSLKYYDNKKDDK